ncbi:DNA invertase Pin-like site-specific DNA recombinase [Actinoplanes lutulentus]|uniref:Resolvase-like protein n=1 Tax=Actinoplanes lutulentus TaxID=1287878 RepID=A0A327Z3J4_9ACTN|nr:recombinase family protein [Actinoplanes lutulentus]MBB2949255.1 DNA invertase Pin-like site-specific DNA recombinase [Actinoplanes lutulentus]RAK28776.1 resolvase-like protein [Actinoplanes lutulentus]
MVVVDGDGGFTRWLQDRPQPRRRGFTPPAPSRRTLRFAFYGRVSTADRQDPAASRQWQREVATQTAAATGNIVRDFFDIGCSRNVPWADRPQARALLHALTDPNRDFDAIIVGESDRAFSGTQLQQILPTLQHHGVALWLPELEGPLNPHNTIHQALVLMLGHDARREVLRARHRTLTAMRVLAREGRLLGGRPPYGYRLVDAGPHPNPVHGQWGRRLNRLDLDPATAGHARWIFAQRLAGLSAATIADMLTQRSIPCPSAANPDRNRHRRGIAWSTRAVDAILSNPRYTGRQVYGRSSSVHDETSADAPTTGRPATRRAVARDQWVVSNTLAHPPLISEATFVAVQQISSLARPADGQPRSYLLRGLVICGICERRPESEWVHGRAAYRCRHGQPRKRPAESALPFYAREDTLLAAAANELHARTGGGQTLWSPALVAEHLRSQNFTLRCTRERVQLLGEISKQLTLAIPGIGYDSFGEVIQEQAKTFRKGDVHFSRQKESLAE